MATDLIRPSLKREVDNYTRRICNVRLSLAALKNQDSAYAQEHRVMLAYLETVRALAKAFLNIYGKE